MAQVSRFRNVWRNRAAALAVALGAAALGWAQPYKIGDHYWPTPNNAFLKSSNLGGFVQPTVSGKEESALFGCVRSNGSQFHEGIDLKPISRDRRGEPLDSIYAFDAGVVRYVNRASSKSSFGQYVVVEHPSIAPGIVSLYAHLRSVPEEIRPGASVSGGQVIGAMGRTASYSIPRDRAHLHFELGQWMGPRFQEWYDRQPYKDANDHGAWNGMNIVGFDVWSLFKALKLGRFSNAADYLRAEPAAAEAVVPTRSMPELLQVNPNLMTNVALPRDFAGWRIEFAWYGAALRFTALSAGELGGVREPTARLLDASAGGDHDCVDLARHGALGGPTSRLKGSLGQIFLD